MLRGFPRVKNTLRDRGGPDHWRYAMSLTKRFAAELFGTFWLVFGGCGAAVLAANFPSAEANGLGIGFLGVALAFGLTVLTMAYAIGHISGCHLNPAVTAGLVAGGRHPARELLPYVGAQVLGGVLGAAILYVIATGNGSSVGSFATNGYAEYSPGGYSLIAALVAEIVLTFMFLLIIMGATDKRAPSDFAPIAIGLGLTLIHLIRSEERRVGKEWRPRRAPRHHRTTQV